jgi:hypothetical protein
MKRNKAKGSVPFNQLGLPFDLTLGLRGFALCGVFILLVQFLRQKNISENYDKLIYIVAIILALTLIAFGYISKRQLESKSGKFVGGSIFVLF